MAKVSPLLPSFNAGEFSRLMDGRTDIDRYKASMQKLYNFIAVPQGPAVGRSGTMFMGPVYDETKRSGLIPFIFSETQALMLEFSHQRLRFLTDDGVVVRPPVAATAVSNSGGKLAVTAAGHGAAVGEQVVFQSFPPETNLNGDQVKVLAVAGNVVTLDTPYQAIPVLGAAKIARVYSIDTPFTDDTVRGLQAVQLGEVVYLFGDDVRPYKLSRYGAYDWRLGPVVFVDGPFAPTNLTGTRLTPNGTGGVAVSTAISNLAAQQVTLNWDFVTPTVVNGYTIYLPRALNSDTNYSLLDQAPGAWTFEGSNDGVTWTTLDEQNDYVLWDGYKSVFFEVKNAIAYRYYKLNCTSARRNGPLQPAIAVPGFQHVIFSTTTSNTFTIKASSVTGINQDRGFLATDVGRFLRYRSSDGNWASLEIVQFVNSTEIVVKPQRGPISNMKGTADWRLGYFSDTTGYPRTAVFFEDRLWLAGMRDYPDAVAGSVTGAYERFSPTSEAGVVADDNAVTATLNSKRLSRVAWLATDERGLLVGTGSGEWVINSGERDGVITARSIKARNSTMRGSAPVEPVKVDRQILYVQRSKRTLREFTYVFEADGYKSPSMSLFASHIGVPKFEELDYAAEPHSIVWTRRGDGSIAGLTYNREENVVGWHVQDFGVVESIAVMPSPSGDQDTLWLQIARTINGQTRRYIEKLTRFWDFDMTVDDAHYVDCGLRYSGAPISRVYGLKHLEGRTVVGVADGGIIPETVVVNGAIDLPVAASKIVVGLPFDAIGATNRIEAGAADGTAQGKIKRIHSAKVRLWKTGGGFIGSKDQWDKLEEITARGEDDLTTDPVPLIDGDREVEWPEGYEGDAIVVFKRPGNIPLPFNVIAIMPQMVTQDGG